MTDRPTDQPTDRPTNLPTDRLMDKAGCRVACTRLKRKRWRMRRRRWRRWEYWWFPRFNDDPDPNSDALRWRWWSGWKQGCINHQLQITMMTKLKWEKECRLQLPVIIHYLNWVLYKKLERDVDAINLVKPLFLISDKNLTAFLMCCVYLPPVFYHLASI